MRVVEGYDGFIIIVIQLKPLAATQSFSGRRYDGMWQFQSATAVVHGKVVIFSAPVALSPKP